MQNKANPEETGSRHWAEGSRERIGQAGYGRAEQSQFGRGGHQAAGTVVQNKANFAGDAATGGGQPEALGLAGRRPTGDHRVFALGDGNTFTSTVTCDTLELYGTVTAKRQFTIRRPD
jgi:hypothetical protein